MTTIRRTIAYPPLARVASIYAKLYDREPIETTFADEVTRLAGRDWRRTTPEKLRMTAALRVARRLEDEYRARCKPSNLEWRWKLPQRERLARDILETLDWNVVRKHVRKWCHERVRAAVLSISGMHYVIIFRGYPDNPRNLTDWYEDYYGYGPHDVSNTDHVRMTNAVYACRMAAIAVFEADEPYEAD